MMQSALGKHRRGSFLVHGTAGWRDIPRHASGPRGAGCSRQCLRRYSWSTRIRLTSILAGNSFRAGKRTDPYLGWQDALLLNWMPVISVLAGRSRAAGFQIAAQPYDDLSALSVASAMRAMGGRVLPMSFVIPLKDKRDP
jgi:hypothetical protein